ncbi:hypothetical protein L1987_45713 [Smallanthus sonchifolius]|uniref:Uncharacterized protein n=1 Tax=Smallanthus sonchifolius TaxID=185202 RepID=A0ACB9FYS0_9ASTR|nr:hypothetical protein L1987_45713 [Smallanthus sonchifolius]
MKKSESSFPPVPFAVSRQERPPLHRSPFRSFHPQFIRHHHSSLLLQDLLYIFVQVFRVPSKVLKFIKLIKEAGLRNRLKYALTYREMFLPLRPMKTSFFYMIQKVDSGCTQSETRSQSSSRARYRV